MRLFVLAVALLAAAVPSLAQQSPFRVSVFASDVGTIDSGGGDVGGVGAAIEYRWNPAWAVELAAASETHTITVGFFSGLERDIDSRPIDLMLHHYFVNSTRWQPFLGGGVHRVTTSDANAHDRTSAEIDGGVHVMVTPSFSIRLDTRGLVRNDFGETYDPSFKTSLGVAWRF